MGIARVAYVDTDWTGAEATIAAPEGAVQLKRVDPHGVILAAGGQTYSISKEALPVLGRYFLAAGLMLGVDINEGWNGPQSGGKDLAGGIVP